MEANKIPVLNQWDRERLEKSIKEIGVQLPVVFDQHGRIIDGFHRKEIAEKLGIDYPTDDYIENAIDFIRDKEIIEDWNY